MSHAIVMISDPPLADAVAGELVRAGWRVSIGAERAPSSAWDALPPDSRGEWAHLADSSIDEALSFVARAHRRDAVSGFVLGSARDESGSPARRPGRGDFEAIAQRHERDAALYSCFADQVIQARTPGAIVSVLPLASEGYSARDGWAAHIAAGGARGLVFAAAGELARHGIRVNAVARGASSDDVSRFAAQGDQARSPLPLGRGVEDGDVAGVVEWLLSPAAALVTGHVVPVDGGELCLAVPPVGAYPLRPSRAVS